MRVGGGRMGRESKDERGEREVGSKSLTVRPCPHGFMNDFSKLLLNSSSQVKCQRH